MEFNYKNILSKQYGDKNNSFIILSHFLEGKQFKEISQKPLKIIFPINIKIKKFKYHTNF